MEQQLKIIRVASHSPPAGIAGSIAGVFRQHQTAVVQAIGPLAVNQAVKALTLARIFLKSDGYEVVFIPKKVDIDVEGNERTAIQFIVEPR